MPRDRPDPGRPPRRDAALNTERLLAAAVRAGLAEGRHVPLAQIAAEAGVGVGTLYRRYPNREALVEALQVRASSMLADIAERALADGGTGLDSVERFLTQSFAVRDDLVLPLHGAPMPTDPEAVRLRDRVRDLVTAIVERGHADGTIRTDVTAWTVVRFGSLLAQPMSDVPGWDETAAEQQAVFLRGIRQL